MDTFSSIVNIERFSPDEWLDESARLSKQYDHILIQEIARKSLKLAHSFKNEELFVVSSLKYYESLIQAWKGPYLLCDLNEGREGQTKLNYLNVLGLDFQESGYHGRNTHFFTDDSSRDRWISRQRKPNRTKALDLLIECKSINDVILYCSIFWMRGYFVILPGEFGRISPSEIRRLFELEQLYTVVGEITFSLIYTRPDWINFTLISQR